MGDRPLLTVFDATKLSFDNGSWRSLVLAVDGNNFTGCMDLVTGKIYFGPLGPSPVKEENHYETIPPSYPCFAGGQAIRPIIHTSQPGGKTGHQQLAQYVLGTLGLALTPVNEERFCGFAVRFEKGVIAFAATSRHLNPGDNGQLEPAILTPLLLYLTAEFGKLPINRKLVKVEARTSPTSVALGLPVKPTVTTVNSKIAMLSQMKLGALTLKKTK